MLYFNIYAKFALQIIKLQNYGNKIKYLTLSNQKNDCKGTRSEWINKYVHI